MKSIDQFLDRTPRKGYNCLDFAREVWFDLMGEDITTRLTVSTKEGHLALKGMGNFMALRGPTDPCFAVMQRFRFSPHLGIYMDRRILHLSGRGAEFQPIEVAMLGFASIRYYI